jgi:hypothetical protein
MVKYTYSNGYYVVKRRGIKRMKMGEYGLSGYLAPDGEWFPCEYKEHSEKALELVEKYKLEETDYNNIAMKGEFIKFGTVPWTEKEGNSMCHVFINRFKKPTLQQIEWLNKNLNKATDKQKNEVLRTFSSFFKIKLALA